MNRMLVVWMVVLFLAAGVAKAQDPAARSITNTVVSINVTPPAAPPSGWAFWVVKETLPENLTPSNFSGPNPMWNAATHTITWSSVTIAPATLGYEVTGECDTRTVSGDIMFVNLLAEVSSSTTTGDTLITGLDPDITPPVITLLGQEIVTLLVNDPYVEAGATAYDNCDGDLTAAIIIDNSSVDTNTIGTYPVTYNVSDLSSNTATEVTRTVNAIDGNQPWIRDVHVLSENTVEVVFCKGMGSGVDVSANYTVSGTGMGTLSIQPDSVSGGLDTWVLTWNNCPIMLSGGDITVSVDPFVEDTVGNTMGFPRSLTHRGGAIATPPVLTMLGSDPIVVECGSVYTDAGVTAIDQCSNDLTASVVTVNPVNTSVPGVYTVTYNVTDAGGNVATEVTRTVGVVDTTPPVITLLGYPSCPPEIVLEHTTYVDAGATAYDACDGDITASIVVGGDIVDTHNTYGTYYVTYNVTDSSGNAATEVIRTVWIAYQTFEPFVVDVDVVSSSSIEVIFSVDMDLGVGVDIPTNYTISGTGIGTLSPHPASVSGSSDVWTLTWDGCPFMLAGGDVTVTVNPAVEDCQGSPMVMPNYRTDISGAIATPPVITLLGTDPVTVECGGGYTDAGVTAIDQCSNDLTASVVTVNPVNTSVPGVYTITYNVTDAGGNAATEVTRTVGVVDTIPPVITLLGYPSCPPEQVLQGFPYVDAGATAYDDCDGDLTASIVVGGDTVNTSTAYETYYVTYNVTDSEGNAATEVIRTVWIAYQIFEPFVADVDIVSSNSIDVVFNKSMDLGVGIDIPTNYTISGTGIGTFSPNPTSVTGSGSIWTLTWDDCPFMLAGGDITITVNPSVADCQGWPMLLMGNYFTSVGGAIAASPVITLLGDNPTTVELGDPYIDAGATAVDQCSNDISASINMVDAVDTGILGAYTVTYNVADAAGNMADEVTRMVNVVPAQPDVPAAGGLGLVVLACATAFGGGVVFRRRR